MTDRSVIPVSVVGGFLGAGKTTLLNRLLRDNDGRRLGVVVNDFGDINIDEKLIVTRDEDMVSLANGCICCSIGNDFLRALISLVMRPDPPEQIIIEASGVADPMRIAAIARADKALRLQGIFVLVDVTQYQTQAADPLLADTVRAQVGAADLLLLTKTDIAKDDQTQVVVELLERERPGVLRIETTTTDVLVSLLFDFSADLRTPSTVRHDPHALFWTGSIACDQACDVKQLTTVLEDCGGLLRCKGIVRSAGGGGQIIQWTAGRLELASLDEAPKEAALVYIGVGAAPAGFERSIQQCFE
ncbi:MAG: CobW family GTP-binding protein [Parvibaculaceae bacterium]|nr:CobW family GTP-binding protein [Parvibaculaceae bacterium]HBM87484.1 cobalamin biosynthesis protein P47K [Rhodobiaceae bacterium]